MMRNPSVLRRRSAWRFTWRWCGTRCALCCALLLFPGLSLRGQAGSTALQAQLDSMQNRLQTAQQQIEEEHAELVELRRQIESLKRQVQPAGDTGTPATAASTEGAADLQEAVAELQERQAINQTEIQVHEQEKVETASKYSVKLHGLVLFNASVNNGAVDQPGQPTIAVPATGSAANGSLTATGQQTLLGLNATGPQLWGAHTYADLEMDFAGETSMGGYASGSNIFRLRTAGMQVAWPKTTVQAGIAPLILTPYYATSYFSIAVPAMSWSGALWGWLPQLGVEQRLDISENQQLILQASLAEIPDSGTSYTSGLGAVTAAERSRYPGTELRTAWQRGARHPVSFGIGGYWSPHSYGASSSGPGGSFNAWAGTADWKISLPARLEFSGSFYDGTGLGGLSAGAFKDILFVYGPSELPGSTKLAGLKDAGGWGQLQFKPMGRLEFNFASGQDNADSGQLRKGILYTTNPYAAMARNRTTFGNVVFRPSSTILLSGEYRKIQSWQITGPANHASLFGLAAGYEF
jgi:hypothetical protein